MRQLLLATTNQGKIREYRHMLTEMSVEVVTLDEVGITQDVEETGATIEENAVLKARAYARMSGMLTLADDSGLEVDALNGEPGVRSARYAGEDINDAQRNIYLLQKLADVPEGKRQARFRCVIAISTPDLTVETAQGTCEGVIALAPKGAQGFGYDPIFFLPELNKHMAELEPDEKNRISHRGQATQGVGPILDRVLAAQRGGARD